MEMAAQDRHFPHSGAARRAARLRGPPTSALRVVSQSPLWVFPEANRALSHCWPDDNGVHQNDDNQSCLCLFNPPFVQSVSVPEDLLAVNPARLDLGLSEKEAALPSRNCNLIA